MILQAGYDCWLTQAADVPARERRFENQVQVHGADDFAAWKEITSRQKDEMVMMNAILDFGNMGYDAISEAEELMRKVREGITEHINDAPLTPNEALEKKDWFPAWEQVWGVELTPGFRLTCGGVLYEVTERHTAAEGIKPEEGSRYYAEVKEITYGTPEHPLAWSPGMKLENGKYYAEGGVKYLCKRDNVMAYGADLPRLAERGYVERVWEVTEKEEHKDVPYEKGMEVFEGTWYAYGGKRYYCGKWCDGKDMDLADLVEQGYLAEEGAEEGASEEGSMDNPVKYEKGTALEAGKYYEQDGVVYLCVLSSEPADADLKDIPDKVKEIGKLQ